MGARRLKLCGLERHIRVSLISPMPERAQWSCRSRGNETERTGDYTEIVEPRHGRSAMRVFSLSARCDAEPLIW